MKWNDVIWDDHLDLVHIFTFKQLGSLDFSPLDFLKQYNPFGRPKLLWCHENRFSSQANGWIAISLDRTRRFHMQFFCRKRSLSGCMQVRNMICGSRMGFSGWADQHGAAFQFHKSKMVADGYLGYIKMVITSQPVCGSTWCLVLGCGFRLRLDFF